MPNQLTAAAIERDKFYLQQKLRELKNITSTILDEAKTDESLRALTNQCVNWARLRCVEAYLCIPTFGLTRYVVDIAGADASAIALQTHLRRKLWAAGWDVEIRMEM